jgi:hypothetical protein
MPDTDPFNVIFSAPLYASIKYNQAVKIDESKLPDIDKKEFEKFKVLFKQFLEKLNNQDQSAFTILSTLMSMWGYTRKYCGMCGRPIVGDAKYVQKRLTCLSCHDSYEIANELYKRESGEAKERSNDDNESYSKEKDEEYSPDESA